MPARKVNRYQTIRYYGGKARLAKWVNSILPDWTDCTYVEPYAGMLSVLLGRDKARAEIANDLDERIVCWWDAVRCHTDELYEMIWATPYSRETFEEALAALDNNNPVRRAWAVHTVLSQGMMASLHSKDNNWRRSMRSPMTRMAPESVFDLRDRLWQVQLENRPAIDILDSVRDIEDCIVYVDPPYRDRKYGYGVNVEHDLREVLQSCKGEVAISGYGDEWDCLGWERFEKEVPLEIGGKGRRTEVLWVNFGLTIEQRFFQERMEGERLSKFRERVGL